jgi:alkylhydroperoxidase family enzyme
MSMPENAERAFDARPDVLAGWVQLNTAIKANMDLRRYELATLAAARRLRSSYCALQHGRVLLEQLGAPVRQIALDRRAAGLDEIDLAVMDLAERVVDDATSIGDEDLRPLREEGFAAYARRVAVPYRDAMPGHYDRGRYTFTERAPRRLRRT